MNLKIFIAAILIIGSVSGNAIAEGLQKHQKDKDKFDLYILMGQSNMAGRGELNDSLRFLRNDMIWMLSQDLKWTVARHPIHFDKPKDVGFGLGMSFAAEMLKARPGVKIGLIPCAVGGTSIDHWKPGAYDPSTSTHPYDDAVVRITEAMKHGKIRGMLWLQGESDCHKDSVSQYLPRLKLLVQRIRKVAKNKKMPVVLGEIGQFNPNYQLFNRELHKAPLIIKNAAVVSSHGLTDKGDHVHFNSRSLNTYGIRFAGQMLKLE